MTKKDKIKKEYQKERRRILRYIRELSKKDQFYTGKVPDIPKNITQASVNRLKKLSNKTIKDKSKYFDRDTGEIFDTKKDYKKAKQESIPDDIPRQEDMLIGAFLDNASKFPKFAYPFLSGWINTLIAQRGKQDVATMLQMAEDNGVTLTWDIAYKEGELNNFAHELLNYLPEVDGFTKDKMDDMLDEIEDFIDYG